MLVIVELDFYLLDHISRSSIVNKK